MDATPFVSVIIPAYHDWHRLELCLRALKKQTYPRDRFEVLVVNNDPDDYPPYEVAGRNILLLEEEKPGSYAARNAGIRASKGDVLAFTDSDCIPDEAWLNNGVQGLVSGADRVAGHIQIFSANEKPKVSEAYELLFAFNQKKYAENGFSATANLMCFRYCFEKAGLFDPSLFSGGDIEWGYRATERGFSISYQEAVTVSHPARGSMADLLKKHRRVAGGAQAFGRSNQKRQSLIRGLVPPIRKFKKISLSSEICLWHKIALIPLSYFLKLFWTVSYQAAIRSWVKPTRQ